MIELLKKQSCNCRKILNELVKSEDVSNDLYLAYKAIEEAAFGCENCPFKECEDFSHENVVKYDALTSAYRSLKTYQDYKNRWIDTIIALSKAYDSLRFCTKEQIKRINQKDFEKVYGDKKIDSSENWFRENLLGGF